MTVNLSEYDYDDDVATLMMFYLFPGDDTDNHDFDDVFSFVFPPGYNDLLCE